VAKREIAKLSKTTDTIFPKAPFERLVRSLAEDVKSDTRFAADGMEAVHEVQDAFLVLVPARPKNLCLKLPRSKSGRRAIRNQQDYQGRPCP